mmetsp:Transcript_76016/g.211202  ORF Transcript_76016/g.211202 Transcript_76016/m.211202 type:complete len:269 (+) Transcript_76016:951-1757(+)
MANKLLTLVVATYRVKARDVNAILPRADVIGNNHVGMLLIGIVDRTKVAEVVNLLDELPMTREPLPVEGRQANAAGLPPRQARERGLHRPALVMEDLVEAIPDHVTDEREIGEPDAAFLGVIEDGLGQLLRPLHRIRPTVRIRTNTPNLLLRLRRVRGPETASCEERDEVGVQNLHRHLPAQELGLRQPFELVGHLNPTGGLHVDEVLESRGEHRKLAQSKPVPPELLALLQEGLEIGRRPFRGGAVRLQATNEPATALHEEAVQDVA